jgi:hypothetical protein
MVEPERLRDELRKMRELIDTDPRVKAYFDRDGNGVIDGDEWEQVRQLVIQRLAREADERALAQQAQQSADVPDEELPVVVGGVAEEIYAQDLPVVAGTVAPPTALALADAHDLILEERGLSQVFAGLARRNYAVLAPDGRELGEIRQRENEALARLAGMGREPDLHFDMRDATSGETFTFRRSVEMMGDNVVIFDGGDRQLGYIEPRPGLVRSGYRVVMTFQNAHATVAWRLTRPFSLSVLDFMDDPVGEIQRGWSGLGAFLGGANRMRIRLEPDALAREVRFGLLAAAVLVDMAQER